MSDDSEALAPDPKIELDSTSGKANIVLDMSALDTFITCPAKYNYRFNRRREVPIQLKPKPLDKGSVIHEGMDVYFNELKNGTHFNDRMQLAVKKIQSYSSNPEVCNLDPDEIDALILAISESCDHWRFEDESLIIHEVERAFAYVLYEDEYLRLVITGKIDLLVDKPAMQGSSAYTNLVIDHKSYQRDSLVTRLTNQFQNYCNAVGSNFLIVNRIGLQKSLKPEEKHKRIILSYDPLILKDWRDNIVDIILNQYLPCLAEQKWFMNFTSCNKFNRMCEYFRVCDASGQPAKEWNLMRYYESGNPWDVTAKFIKN